MQFNLYYRQGLEKYIMTKLFSRTFCTSLEEAKINHEVSEKIKLLQTFLKPQHLDIQPVLHNESSWLVCYASSSSSCMIKFQIN